MDFNFNSEGVGFCLELLEVDPHASSSAKFRLKFDLKHPTGTFTYTADDIWLDIDMWDEFEKQLLDGLVKPAVFFDQSQYFEFRLCQSKSELDLLIKIREPMISTGDVYLESRQEIDKDSVFVSSLINSLNEFSKF